MQLRTTASRVVLALALASTASALTGCIYTRESLYARAMPEGGVHVRVQGAHVIDGRVVVRTSMQNRSNRTIVVHRDQIGLRLADGTTVAGARGRRSHKPVVIRPGQSRNVKVAFRAPLQTDLSTSHLVLGGVHVRGERGSRTLGEVALASEHALLPISRSAASTSAPFDPQTDTEEAAAEQAAEESGGAEPADEDEAEDEADQEPASEEAWQIGGG